MFLCCLELTVISVFDGVGCSRAVRFLSFDELFLCLFFPPFAAFLLHSSRLRLKTTPRRAQPARSQTHPEMTGEEQPLMGGVSVTPVYSPFPGEGIVSQNNGFGPAFSGGNRVEVHKKIHGMVRVLSPFFPFSPSPSLV